jgi:hypothetical protein
MSEMFARPSKESHEGTIHYAARMLRHCLDRIVAFRNEDSAGEELIVHLECFLLHYRNLAHFLSGKGGSHGDLKITNWMRWSSKRLSEEEVAKVTQSATAIYWDYCSDISTYLSHCTRERYEKEKDWNPQKMLNDIAPAIRAFEGLFPPNRVGSDAVAVATPEASSTGSGFRPRRER